MQKLYGEGKIKLRIYNAVYGPGEAAEKLLKDGPMLDAYDHHFTTRTIKVIFDGSLGSRSAALLHLTPMLETSGFLTAEGSRPAPDVSRSAAPRHPGRDARDRRPRQSHHRLRQLRYIRDKLRSIQLSVGHDARNRTVLWPFSSKSSRTQPKAKHWIFSPSVWMRFLIKPEPGRALAYIDYSSMEFLGAAALSDGHTGPSNPMLELYRSGDPYLNFGKIIGQIAPDATRKTPGIDAIRERLKVLCLGTQYGMQTATLASRLGVSDIEAHEMLMMHRGLLSQYWHYSEDWLHHALDNGTMKTVLGWQCATGITEFNERSIRNWPVQSNCADLFRLAYVWGTRRGLTLIAPVHDAVLLESSEDQIEADVALMREIMRRASRVILNPTADGTIELRTDVKIIRHPDRFTDSRGVELWEVVLKLLAERRERVATDPSRKTG